MAKGNSGRLLFTHNLLKIRDENGFKLYLVRVVQKVKPMSIGNIKEIKDELIQLNQKELIQLVLDLGKASADNKAFIYLKLKQKDDPEFFMQLAKDTLQQEFGKGNTSNPYYAKKSAQAVRRNLNKFLKWNKDKSTQAELILYFCRELLAYGYLRGRHPVVVNLLQAQFNKVEKLISGMHEDLRYDYEQELDELIQSIHRDQS